jgi:hypothetical protein
MNTAGITRRKPTKSYAAAVLRSFHVSLPFIGRSCDVRRQWVYAACYESSAPEHKYPGSLVVLIVGIAPPRPLALAGSHCEKNDRPIRKARMRTVSADYQVTIH